MKKIALAGAPGSGKARLAGALAKELDDASVIFASDYVAQVEASTDIACEGYVAPYLGDVAVAIQRYGNERVVSNANPSFLITCGTLAETQLYTAISLSLAGGEMAWAIANVTMGFYALMGMTVWDYDLVLRLPLVDSSIELDIELDAGLDESLRKHKVSYTTLPSWEEGQLDTALAWIEGLK